MLYRKIESFIRGHLKSGTDRILIVEGARQIGKSFIIRHVCRELFKNFVELNFAEDKEGPKDFENVHSITDFYIQLSSLYGKKLGSRKDTVIFLDEIQEYPQYLTLLKFLREDGKFTFVASGSLLGITLRQTTSIPIGSILIKDMYPMDFEEFMIANGVGKDALEYIKSQFHKQESLNESMHRRVMELFKHYLIVGGMPQAVDSFVRDYNVETVREIQNEIIKLYKVDASKYDDANKLNIRRIYELIPSAMENKKKRIILKEIESFPQVRYSKYAEDFEYVISSGIAIPVRAISNPHFPLLESSSKNLIKLYMNDVGLLTSVLFSKNIRPILEGEKGVNLGAVYESVVAQQLQCQVNRLFYYDNKKYGEVDFLIDDYENLSVLPVEVKSGKDYTRHTSLSRFVSVEDYHIKQAVVLYDGREVVEKDGIIYMPAYFSIFLAS